MADSFSNFDYTTCQHITIGGHFCPFWCSDKKIGTTLRIFDHINLYVTFSPPRSSVLVLMMSGAPFVYSARLVILLNFYFKLFHSDLPLAWLYAFSNSRECQAPIWDPRSRREHILFQRRWRGRWRFQTQHLIIWKHDELRCSSYQRRQWAHSSHASLMSSLHLIKGAERSWGLIKASWIKWAT